jgi:16S rRNA processing protein RimM
MSGPPPLPDPERRALIGRIVKVRGLKGDLKVVPVTWKPERFHGLSGVWVELPAGEARYLTLKRARIEGGMVYVRFAEAARREYAEELVGGQIVVDQDERLELPEDHFYLDQLEGLDVVCSRLGALGRIVEVLDLPANDVWRVEGPRGEVLIPAIRQVVDEVDLAARRARVTLPEGLVEEEEEAGEGESGEA